jgi:hypothetical protein
VSGVRVLVRGWELCFDVSPFRREFNRVETRAAAERGSTVSD